MPNKQPTKNSGLTDFDGLEKEEKKFLLWLIFGRNAPAPTNISIKSCEKTLKDLEKMKRRQTRKIRRST